MINIQNRNEIEPLSRTAIIGMGIGGMATALHLGVGDYFEGSNEVGGRVRTLELGSDVTGEAGGEFFDRKQVDQGAVGRLIAKINEIFGHTRVKLRDLAEVNSTEEMSFAAGNRLITNESLDTEFATSLYAQINKDYVAATKGAPDMTLNVLNAKAVRDSRPRLAELDSMTMAEYIDRGINASPEMKNVLRTTFEALNHLPVEQQSAINLLDLLGTSPVSEGFNPFGAHDDGAYVLEGGGRNLTSAMKSAIEKNGRRIQFGHKLLRIKKLSNGSYELTFQYGDKRVTRHFENVVINLPIPMLAQLEDLDGAGFSPQQLAAIKATKFGQGGKTLFGITGDKYNGLGSDGIRTVGGAGIQPYMLWNTFSNPGDSAKVLTRLESQQQFDPRDHEKAEEYFRRLAQQTDISMPGTIAHMTGHNARTDWVQRSGGTYPTPTPGYYQNHFGSLQQTPDNSRLFLVGDFPRYDEKTKLNMEYGYMNTAVASAEEVAKKLQNLLGK